MQWKQCTHALSLLAQLVISDSSSSLLGVPVTLCHAIAKVLALLALQVFMFLFDKSGKLLHANQQALYNYCGPSGMMHCCTPVCTPVHWIDDALYIACAFAQACIPCLCLYSCAVGSYALRLPMPAEDKWPSYSTASHCCNEDWPLIA